MTYGVEAVILLKANFPTLRTNSFTPSGNDELLGERLDDAKGRWVEKLPHVLWAYRTTP